MNMKQILIVDDNPIMLRLYEYHMKAKGWEAHFFDNAESAIEKLGEMEEKTKKEDVKTKK